MRNKRVVLLFMIVWIIQIKNIEYKNKQKKNICYYQPQGDINTNLSFYKKYNQITYIDDGHYYQAHDITNGNDSGSDSIVFCPIPYQQRECQQ